MAHLRLFPSRSTYSLAAVVALTACGGTAGSLAPAGTTAPQSAGRLGATPLSCAKPCPAATIPPGPNIYVTNHGAFGVGSNGHPSVTVYPVNASGNATPVAILSGAATQENQLQYVAVGRNGTLWVSNVNQGGTSGTVAGFGASAQVGNVAPKQRLTGLNTPEGVAIGPSGNLFVATIDSLYCFTPKSNGNAKPLRLITGSKTQISTPYQVFVDRNGFQYLAEQNAVYVWPNLATGNVAPKQLITGAATMLQDVLGVAVDSSGTIYATNLDANDVVEFARGAKGNQAPSAVVTSTSFNQPWGIFIDQNDTVYVANRGNDSILVFASGTLAAGMPTATISGGNTGLDNPIGVTVK